MVVGAGGHARVILDTFAALPDYEIVGLTDTNQQTWGSTVAGYPVLGGDRVLPELRNQGVAGVFVAVGENKPRARIFAQVIAMGFTPVNAVHPHSCISPSIALGVGVAVMAGVVINTNTSIGDNIIINTGATIDHDCIISDHAHIAPGCHLSGTVHVGEGTLLGTGTSVINGVSIGSWSVVGGGAAVVSDIPEGVVAVGVPARVIKEYNR